VTKWFHLKKRTIRKENISKAEFTMCNSLLPAS
jgi:hypothetical protein